MSLIFIAVAITEAVSALNAFYNPEWMVIQRILTAIAAKGS
jgi:hypothetical protein